MYWGNLVRISSTGNNNDIAIYYDDELFINSDYPYKMKTNNKNFGKDPSFIDYSHIITISRNKCFKMDNITKTWTPILGENDFDILRQMFIKNKLRMNL